MRETSMSIMYEMYVIGIQIPPCRKLVKHSVMFVHENPVATNGLRKVYPASSNPMYEKPTALANTARTARTINAYGRSFITDSNPTAYLMNKEGRIVPQLSRDRLTKKQAAPSSQNTLESKQAMDCDGRFC